MAKAQEPKHYQHYYMRHVVGPATGPKHPYVTVAISPGEEPGTVNRGISLLSELDKWDKKKGLRKALGRLRRASATKACSDKVGKGISTTSNCVSDFLYEYGHEYASDLGDIYKSAYNVPASTRELPILDNLIRRIAESCKTDA